jgi:hypothetical protein
MKNPQNILEEAQILAASSFAKPAASTCANPSLIAWLPTA